MIVTTDHKKLGIMYIVMAFCFFFLGGLMALLIRVELFHPGLQFLSNGVQLSLKIYDKSVQGVYLLLPPDTVDCLQRRQISLS